MHKARHTAAQRVLDATGNCSGHPEQNPRPSRQLSPCIAGRIATPRLVGPGVTSGLNMHRARHTFATEPRRVAGIDAASHALGHADLNTTLGIYGHFDESDLQGAMEAYARWLAGQEGAPIVPPEDPL